MSDTITQSLKVSREGIVLIKSFEGFRPRAVPRPDGGWVIGYGHTLSAREGASVSEADAELLLRYDLLAVEKALNATVPAGLNQHQFDALVSFAFSVGLDRFAGSDVRQRLADGAPAEAADAMMGWPEPILAQTALRRRAAERALFTADPAGPVALADLLAAPLPPPPMVPVQDQPTPTETTDSAASHTPPDPEQVADPRGAAVAVLLGEVDPAPVADEAKAGVPTFSVPVFDDDVDPAAGPSQQPESETHDGSLHGDQPVSVPAMEADISDHPSSTGDAPVSIASPETDADFPALVADPRPSSSGSEALALSVARYAPYATTLVGPLPYLLPAGPSLTEHVPASTATETAAVADQPHATQSLVVAEGVPEHAPLTEEPAAEPAVVPLVLTAPEDAPEPALARALWTPEQRAEPLAPTESGLFGEDLSLTLGGGPILRHETEPEAPARFDWSETGAFVIMGAVGLTAFGASMAAFRLASEQSDGGNETTMIAWVLAVIGAACVGVSSFNLYRRWGLPGGD